MSKKKTILSPAEAAAGILTAYFTTREDPNQKHLTNEKLFLSVLIILKNEIQDGNIKIQ